MIVAIKEKSCIYVGYNDSLTINGNIYHGINKVWQCKPNEVFMAGVGNLNVINEVKNAYPYPLDVPKASTCSTYLQEVNEYFKKQQEYGYEFIIFGSAKIFTISSTGLILEPEEFIAIGQGREIALSVLDINRNLGPQTRIQQAFEQTIKYRSEVCGEIKISIF